MVFNLSLLLFKLCQVGTSIDQLYQAMLSMMEDDFEGNVPNWSIWHHKTMRILGFHLGILQLIWVGSTQNVLMIMLYWSDKIWRNCTYLLPNTRSTHTVKNYFPPITVHRFGVDPQWNYDVTWNPRIRKMKFVLAKIILTKLITLYVVFVQLLNSFQRVFIDIKNNRSV